MAWRAYPLFRHAGADGALTRASPSMAARDLGGCCGNKPAHVAAMRRALDAYVPGERPTMEASSRRSARWSRRRRRRRRQPAAPAGALVTRGPSCAPGVDTAEADDGEPAACGRGEPLDWLAAPEASGLRRRRREGRATGSFPRPSRGGKVNCLSRTRLKSLIEAGEVRIDEGSPAILRRGLRRGIASPSLGAGAETSDRRRGHPARGRLRGRDLIVIDKPAGIVVHPAPGHQAGTLVNALIHHCGRRLGDRWREAAGHRAPPRQGHVRASGRRQDRRRAPGHRRFLRRPRAHRLA